jgi:Glycosyltransferase family 87
MSTTFAGVETPSDDDIFLDRVRRTLQFVGFGLIPLCLIVAYLSTGGRARGFDFQQFWQGGHDVAHGVSPYPATDRLPDAGAKRLDPIEIQQVFRFPYPAPAAVALAPLGLLPLRVATGIFLGLLILCIPGSLLALGVRDWRCYGVAFLWLPVLTAVRLGTLTPLLLLGVALAWRFRNRTRSAAAALAGASVAKVFLWPLLVWLGATRRARTALLAATLAVGITLGTWAGIGFAGLTDYPALIDHLSHAVEDEGYSLTALAVTAGGSATVGHALGFAVGAFLLAASFWMGRRLGGDGASLALALAAALALTPIVWLHYFALLLIPIAIASPRLSVAWLLPILFWVTPEGGDPKPLWRIATALTIAIVTMALVLRALKLSAKPGLIAQVRGAHLSSREVDGYRD